MKHINHTFTSHYTSLTRGFTLIELIVVIAVISIMATALLSTISPFEQFKKSRDTDRKVAIAQIQKALESYYQDHGRYPDSSADYRIISVVNGVTSTLSWGDSWPPYMDKLSKDPTTGHKIAYYSPAASNGQIYYIYMNLERGSKDPAVCNGGLKCTSLPSNLACGGVSIVCNFGVSSPNVKP